MIVLRRFFISIIFFFNLTFVLSSLSYSQDAAKFDYGLAAFKKANCMGCHKWHGEGGPGYGGAALSLRTTELDADELYTLIQCGRPGTNMPFYDKKAYIDDRCYGMTFEDFEGDDENRPLVAKTFIRDRQIKQIVDFVLTDLKGKELSMEYCVKFFGKPSRSCRGLE